MPLDHGAHGAVEKHDALPENLVNIHNNGFSIFLPEAGEAKGVDLLHILLLLDSLLPRKRSENFQSAYLHPGMSAWIRN
jgi:hypothetical protein